MEEQETIKGVRCTFHGHINVLMLPSVVIYNKNFKFDFVFNASVSLNSSYSLRHFTFSMS